jgi:hypothetical protein
MNKHQPTYIMKQIFFLFMLFISVNVAFAQVSVRGYYRKNGTYVQPHYRSSPNSTVTDNYSYKGNINPYTGTIGTNSYNNTYRIGNKTNEYEGGVRQYKKVQNKKVTLSQKTYFYTSSGSNSKINFIHENKEVEILGKCDNGYYLIKYDNKEGYLEGKYISDINNITYSNQILNDSIKAIFIPKINLDSIKVKVAIVVVKEALMIESYDSFGVENIIETIPKGTEIQVLYEDKDGFYVVKHNRNIGFMVGLVFKYKVDKNPINESRRRFNIKSLFTRK